MVTLADAAGPEGCRVYVIGDVHGLLDRLTDLERRIAQDASDAACHRIVLLGDLIDRGPDSAGVIDWLVRGIRSGRASSVLGNHDLYLLQFLADPHGAHWPAWLVNGGEATLASFGALPRDPERLHAAAGREEARERVLARLGAEGLACLEGLPAWLRLGDYAAVHAGVRPGVALEDQARDDLLWIREAFLDSDADFGAVILHGHTPRREIEVRPNRIGLDTGAVFGGPLSCLAIDGRERWLLTARGREPLPPVPDP